MNDEGLCAAVSRAVGAPAIHVEEVRREALAYDAFLAGRSVVRVRGTAVTPNGAVPWSMTEKATEGKGAVSAYLYDNALREFHAYDSGLLDDLAPAVAAPTAYGLQKGADGRLTLWLEDVGQPRQLSPSDILLVAHDLGRLAGRWVDRVPLHPWLFTGWIERHSQRAAAVGDIARLHAVRRRSAVEARLGWAIREAIELIERQSTFRRLLERMPQTLCHHDAVGANVVRRRRDGKDETVLFDWETVGPGAIGADLASLLFSSARRGDCSATALPQVLSPALDAYEDGMNEMGAPVDADVLRLAFHAAVALRWSLARDVVIALDDGAAVRRGSAPEESPEESLTELIALTRVLRDSAGEAGRLST